MIKDLIPAARRDLGGFSVERALPAPRRRMVGPFVFLDHMGPADFAPGGGVDVRPHPHIGLSTVTYLFDGEIVHKDSLGTDLAIRPGEVNWMTAGSGIVHSERTEPDRRARGASLHGMQAWVALPKEHEETAPAFTHHGAEDLPAFVGDGLAARLIAGAAFGAVAPVPTFSPLFYVHWSLAAGRKAQLEARYSERAAFLAAGRVEIDGRAYEPGGLLVFEAGEPVVFTALEASEIILLGGEPLGERFVWWNFVSSSKERIESAKADWRAGRMILPPGDDLECIPLPDDPPPPAEPMS